MTNAEQVLQVLLAKIFKNSGKQVRPMLFYNTELFSKFGRFCHMIHLPIFFNLVVSFSICAFTFSVSDVISAVKHFFSANFSSSDALEALVNSVARSSPIMFLNSGTSEM